MDNTAITNVWAKTSKTNDAEWHPLILHMLDVAASTDSILAREPESTRVRMAAILGMAWEEARAWFLLVVACHDLGKACPGFQCKWPGLLRLTGLELPRSPNTQINHAFVSQIALSEVLQDMGWPEDLAKLVADAVGCHHGERASPTVLFHLEGNRSAIGSEEWMRARRALVDALVVVLKPAKLPTKPILNGPDFMLLSGLTSFCRLDRFQRRLVSFRNPRGLYRSRKMV